MARPGLKKTPSYGLEFKRAAVQLSYRPGIQVQAVAEALDIHPYMLSRWRKEFREGRLRPKVGDAEQKKSKQPRVREIRRLQELEREHRMLQEEHALRGKIPGRPVTPLAQDASVAPVRPARYALRWAVSSSIPRKRR